VSPRRDIFNSGGWYRCAVEVSPNRMVRVATASNLKDEVPNPWLEPAAARRLALALLAAAMEAEEGL
jgi:hypothetical protein